MQLQLPNLLEDFIEVFEQDIGLLTVENVMVADDGPRLHAELRLGEDEEGLAIFLILLQS